MTTRQLTLPSDILDTLDQRLAILANQINARLTSLADLEFAINEVRGQLLRAYELSSLNQDDRTLITSVVKSLTRAEEVVDQARESLKEELVPHAESTLAESPGAGSPAPPGPEATPAPGLAEPSRKRPPRRRGTAPA